MCHSGNRTLHRLPQCPLLFPWFHLIVPASSPWLFIKSLQRNSGQRTEHGVQPGEWPPPCLATWPWTGAPALCSRVLKTAWRWWCLCFTGMRLSHLTTLQATGVVGAMCSWTDCLRPVRPPFSTSILLQRMIRYLSHILLSAFPSLSSVGSQCRATSLLFPQSKASGAPILGCQVAIRQFVIQDFSPPGACFMLLSAFSWAWPSLAHLFSSSVFFPPSASLPPFLSCLPNSPFSQASKNWVSPSRPCWQETKEDQAWSLFS